MHKNKDEELENKIQQNKSKIEQLEIELESRWREEQAFLKELKVSAEQLSTFVSNPNNFTEESWQELNKQQTQLDEKLHRELNNIRNPLRTKKTYASLHVQPHWLYVR